MDNMKLDFCIFLELQAPIMYLGSKSVPINYCHQLISVERGLQVENQAVKVSPGGSSRGKGVEGGRGANGVRGVKEGKGGTGGTGDKGVKGAKRGKGCLRWVLGSPPPVGTKSSVKTNSVEVSPPLENRFTTPGIYFKDRDIMLLI